VDRSQAARLSVYTGQSPGRAPLAQLVQASMTQLPVHCCSHSQNQTAPHQNSKLCVARCSASQRQPAGVISPPLACVARRKKSATAFCMKEGRHSCCLTYNLELQRNQCNSAETTRAS